MNKLISIIAYTTLTIITSPIAQEYPTKSIRIIVPYSPGGGLDVVGRPLAQKLSDLFNQPITLENRPGAGTTIGTNFVAKSSPDGYTLLLTLSALTIGPSIYPNLPYDPIKDFQPIVWIGTSSYILSTHPSVPVQTINDLIKLSKRMPNKLNYSSPGNGTDPHMATELFKMLTGSKLVHIPYSGGSQAATSVIAGQVDLTFLPTSLGIPFIKSSKLRAIAISTLKRSQQLPDLPTIDESGAKGFSAEAWSGILAPAKTPNNIVNKLNTNIQKIIATNEYKNLLESRMVEIVGSNVDKFSNRIRDDVTKWKKVSKEMSINSLE